MYNALFLDLDGTLIDSAAGVEWAFHAALEQTLPDCSREKIERFIGPPVNKMFEDYLAEYWPRSLAERELAREALVPVFREFYDGEGCLKVKPYAGVEDTLIHFQEMKIPIVIVTNKPAQPAARVFEKLKWNKFWNGVICPDTYAEHFEDKTAMARHALEKFGFAPQSTLLVGDSRDDASAAHENEIPFAAVAYGYGGAPALTEYSPRYILNNFPELEVIVTR